MTPESKLTERWLTVKEFRTLYRVAQFRFRKWRDSGQIKTVTFQIPTAKGTKRAVRVLDPGWPLVDEAAKTGNPTEDLALLRASEVAAVIGITREGVAWLTRSGKLKASIVTPGGHRQYSLNAIRRYLSTRGKKRPAKRETSVAMVAWAKQHLGTAPPPAPKPLKGLNGIREKERWARIRETRNSNKSTSQAGAPGTSLPHPSDSAAASVPSPEQPKTA